MKNVALCLFMAGLVLVCSCAKPSYQITSYESVPQRLTEEKDNYIIRAGDKLAIQSFNNLASVLFESTVNNTTANSQSVPEFEAWVDKDGYTLLPKAGRVKVAGLTQKEASRLVEQAYKNIIQSPSFNVIITTRKVKVLGAVNKQGLYTLQREDQTLSEVLAMAEGIRYENLGKKLLIVRDTGTGSHTMAFNMNTWELANPQLNNIIIKDNDIVYVMPSKASVNASRYQQINSYLTPVSLLLNAAVLIITITR